MDEFKLYESRLCVKESSSPEAQFAIMTVLNEKDEPVDNVLVMFHSYLLTRQEIAENYKKNGIQTYLLEDKEIGNFVKFFLFSYLEENKKNTDDYCFYTAVFPLENTEEEDVFLRFGISVCYRKETKLHPKAVIDLACDFMEQTEPVEVDVISIQSQYNSSLKFSNTEKQQNLYYFKLNKLSEILRMPFRSKGKVYKNYRSKDCPYVYETDTMLLDFLDEFEGSVAEMEVVVEDVSKIFEKIK